MWPDRPSRGLSVLLPPHCLSCPPDVAVPREEDFLQPARLPPPFSLCWVGCGRAGRTLEFSPHPPGGLPLPLIANFHGQAYLLVALRGRGPPPGFPQGTQQLCAGYCMYGQSTILVMTLGNGVNAFTLHSGIGEFILTHPNIRIPGVPLLPFGQWIMRGAML